MVMDEVTDVVVCESPDVLPRREKIVFAELLAPLTTKQRKFLVYIALGEDEKSSQKLVGIQWRTWSNWTYQPAFSWALERVKAELSPDLSNQAAQIFLGGYSIKVLQDIADMAEKDWKDLHSSYEYQAKTKCMEIVQKSQGFTGPEKTNVNVGWAENVAILLEGGKV